MSCLRRGRRPPCCASAHSSCRWAPEPLELPREALRAAEAEEEVAAPLRAAPPPQLLPTLLQRHHPQLRVPLHVRPRLHHHHHLPVRQRLRLGPGPAALADLVAPAAPAALVDLVDLVDLDP